MERILWKCHTASFAGGIRSRIKWYPQSSKKPIVSWYVEERRNDGRVGPKLRAWLLPILPPSHLLPPFPPNRPHHPRIRVEPVTRLSNAVLPMN